MSRAPLLLYNGLRGKLERKRLSSGGREGGERTRGAVRAHICTQLLLNTEDVEDRGHITGSLTERSGDRGHITCSLTERSGDRGHSFSPQSPSSIQRSPIPPKTSCLVYCHITGGSCQASALDQFISRAPMKGVVQAGILGR
ncbi:unnamed protein product [Pleuronectes platessa]|uniref:Uncharacterized protein n=1 Tax=Pleuronectes platessa TaxID=8262 RepID=A0A9N7VCZ3_PLEPL|nr:unnamed protein product [Pleuronectes platessa]